MTWVSQHDCMCEPVQQAPLRYWYHQLKACACVSDFFTGNPNIFSWSFSVRSCVRLCVWWTPGRTANCFNGIRKRQKGKVAVHFLAAFLVFSRQQGPVEQLLNDWRMHCHLLNNPTLSTYGSIIVPLAERKRREGGARGGRIKIRRMIIEDEKEAAKVGRMGRARKWWAEEHTKRKKNGSFILSAFRKTHAL